ncbi:MAG: saccharopine dehydrogenase family protein [Bradymonadia bacterium]
MAQTTSSEGRPYDVILYGATGFTGRQTAEYFLAHAPADVKWAVAGRNLGKLKALLDDLGPKAASVDVVVANSADPASVDAMAAQTRVLLTTAGPFALYGTPVVEACVRHQTDYVDITGETPWARDMIDAHHDEAVLNGTRIIPFCGFDSVPSDLGTLWMVHEIKSRFDQPTRSVRAAFVAKGGFNGGTLASATNMGEAGVNRRMGDPVLLNPKPHRTKAARERSKDVREPAFDEDLQTWLTPFFMAPVNTRVVRRSHALFSDADAGYGPHFVYQETMEVKSKRQAWAMALGLGAFAKAVSSPLGRRVIKRLAPAPGEGPSDEAMDNGFMRVRYIAESEDGRKLLGTLKSKGDPGNRITVKILCEAALMLATDRGALPEAAGVITPALGLGLGLKDRLEAAGMSFSVDELP